MNRFDFGAVRKPGDQYWGMIRLPRHGQFVPVCKDGKPIYFHNEADALRVAGKIVLDAAVSKIRSDGEALTSAKANAELIFGEKGRCLSNRSRT